MHIVLHPESKPKKSLTTIKQKTEFSGEERKIVFKHGRAPGDNIMFTAG
ncbi:unnamed protein product, partial [marine sediment metagenome]